jgi:hypothetical protein
LLLLIKSCTYSNALPHPFRLQNRNVHEIAWDSWPAELPSAAEVRACPEYVKLTDEAGQRELHVEVSSHPHHRIP